jgi:hypothetical protein
VVQPYAESGNIYLPDPPLAPWVEDYIAEFQTFPNGAHDDQVDATSQAINWLLKRMKHSFPPIVTSVTQSTNPWHGGNRPTAEGKGIVVRNRWGQLERYYDPRGE